MNKIFRLKLFFIIYSIVFSLPSLSQDNVTNVGVLDNSLRDSLIIAGSAASGAVIGLSTLSFTKEPSKKTNNIVIGSAIGVIVGVVVVAWLQAGRSRDYYNQHSLNDIKFSTISRIAWHDTNRSEFYKSDHNTIIRYNFSF